MKSLLTLSVALTSCSALHLGSLIVHVKFPLHEGPYMNAPFDG